MTSREWDCGYWERGTHFGRVTVRQCAEDLFEVLVVWYERGTLRKYEEQHGAFHTLEDAKEYGWKLRDELDRSRKRVSPKLRERR